VNKNGLELPNIGIHKPICETEDANDTSLCPDGVDSRISLLENKLQVKCCGRKRSSEKRVQILTAAMKLFSEQDYHVVCMDHIAEKAGVGKGTLYRYFPDKEKLFLELLHVAVESSIEVIDREIVGDSSVQEKLRRIVKSLLNHYRTNAPLLAIWSHEKIFRHCRQSSEYYAKRAQLRLRLEQLLVAGVADGSLRSDFDPIVGALVLTTSLRSLIRTFGSTQNDEDMATRILDIFFYGALPHPAAGSLSDFVEWPKP
jgi:AcrR family transcriptional regulator